MSRRPRQRRSATSATTGRGARRRWRQASANRTMTPRKRETRLASAAVRLSPSQPAMPATQRVRRLQRPGANRPASTTSSGEGRERGEVVDAQERVCPPAALRDEVVEADDVGDERHGQDQVDEGGEPVLAVEQRDRAETDHCRLDHPDAGDQRRQAVPRGGREQPQREQRHRRGEHPVVAAGLRASRPLDGDERRPRARGSRDPTERSTRRSRAGARVTLGWLIVRIRPRAVAAANTATIRRPGPSGTIRRAKAAYTAAYDTRWFRPPMRIVFLTGIWPPDVGGPATHGPDFARFLRDRGPRRARSSRWATRAPSERPVPVHWVSRGLPFVARYPLVAARRARASRGAPT